MPPIVATVDERSALESIERFTFNESRRVERSERRARTHLVAGFEFDELAELAASNEERETIAGVNWEAAERNVWIRGALEMLPEEDREIFVSHHVLDLPLEEVAEQFAMTRDVVRTRLRYVRRWLRTLLLHGTSELSRSRYSVAAACWPLWG